MVIEMKLYISPKHYSYMQCGGVQQLTPSSMKQSIIIIHLMELSKVVVLENLQYLQLLSPFQHVVLDGRIE